MKSLGSDKQENKASKSTTTENCDQIATVEEKIDFSNVKIEPLFEETVDFDTFSKSDFRAVKVKEWVACRVMVNSLGPSSVMVTLPEAYSTPAPETV